MSASIAPCEDFMWLTSPWTSPVVWIVPEEANGTPA